MSGKQSTDGEPLRRSVVAIAERPRDSSLNAMSRRKETLVEFSRMACLCKRDPLLNSCLAARRRSSHNGCRDIKRSSITDESV